MIRDYRNQLVWWTGKTRKKIIVIPTFKNLLEFFRSINRINLNWLERFYCYRELTCWMLREGFEQIKYDLVNEYLLFRLKIIRG